MDEVLAAIGCLWMLICLAIGLLLVWGLYEVIMWLGRN